MRSTKTKPPPNDSTTMTTPEAPKMGIKHRDIYLHVYDAKKRSMYMDQTGKFPVTSSRGNQYLMVAVEMDGN